MSKIKIAIVGCGGIATHAHWPAYEKITDRFEVVACCDILPERAKAFAEERKIPFFCTDYHDILKIEGLQAVDICTPNLYHSSIAVDALNAGLHVLCEKPDAISVQEAEKMKAAAERNNRLLMVIRNNRFNAESIFLKKFIEDGKMGEIYAARCGWQRRRGIPGKGGWFTTKALSGGGPLIDLGVHMIDLVIWLMGNPRPVAVSGCTYNKFADTTLSDSDNSKFGNQKEDGVFDVEDLAMGFIRFDNGACLQIEFSWASNVQKEDKFFELRGTKAGAEKHAEGNVEGTFRIYSEECGALTDFVPHISDGMTPHCKNILNFADAICGTAAPVFLPQQGVDMIKVLSGIYESAESGHEIQL